MTYTILEMYVIPYKIKILTLINPETSIQMLLFNTNVIFPAVPSNQTEFTKLPIKNFSH